MITKKFVASSVAVLIVVALVTAVSASPAVAKDSRFFVTAGHTPEECLKTLDEVNAKGQKLLSTLEWGCMSGDHTCYALIDAKDEAAVKDMLPPSMKNAKIVKVSKFSAQQIKSFHEKH
jgi:hypothetical protein